eukprot:1544894-Pyramimonas_sp.AAC.2
MPRAKLRSIGSPRSVLPKPVHSTKVRVRSPWQSSSNPNQSAHSSKPVHRLLGHTGGLPLATQATNNVINLETQSSLDSQHPWQQCSTMLVSDQRPLAKEAMTDRLSRMLPEVGSRN